MADDDENASGATNDGATDAPPTEAQPGAEPGETPPAEAPAQAQPAGAGVTPPKKKKAKKPKDGATASARADGKAREAAPEDDGQFGATGVLASLPGAGTPDGDTLRDAWAAFETGDYGTARGLAARITQSEDRDVAAGAQDVLRRTGVDQVQIAFLAACALAILTIAWIYIPH